MVEEEAAKRIELLVKRRVDEELDRRKDEIEAEVSKRVEAAKRQMEHEMMVELEKRREAAREEERKREVGFQNDASRAPFPWSFNPGHFIRFRCHTAAVASIQMCLV